MRYIICIAVLAILFITGCSSHSMMDHPPIKSEEIFIIEMIPHHQEAIDTSRLVIASKNAQVASLAGSIISAQETEIAMMNGWLSEWYTSSQYKSSYKNMMPNLQSLEGTSRDKAYLEGMILHHKGAIQMAKQAQTIDLRPQVRALTDAIISEQEKEIALMNSILELY